MKFFKNRLDWHLLSVIILAIIMAAGYSFFYYGGSSQANEKLIFNSPDETANYQFAKNFAQTGSLKFSDPANGIAQDLVSPRSMRVINGFTVPASFLGLPIIYGFLAKLTSINWLPLFTPFFAFWGLIFFYLLIKEIFNKTTAFYSTFLAAIFPGWWYYATKGFMPNVLFISLAIIAGYLSYLAVKKRFWLYYVLAGLAWSVTLAVRTSEIFWLIPVFVILLIFNVKKINYLYLLFGLLALGVGFSGILYYNTQIYGHPFSIGYDLGLNANNPDLISQGLSLFRQIFLPFGWHPQESLKHLIDYTFRLFPLWTILLIVGWLIFTFQAVKKIIKKQSLVEIVYLLACLTAFSYITIYYGSWTFNDNPDPTAITIGTSYVRYFLPIYLFSLPPLGLAFTELLGTLKRVRSSFFCFIFYCLFILSFNLVMLNPQEGIFKVKKNLADYQSIAQKVLAIAPLNSIIIAEKMDKVFFPYFSVIYKLNVLADYDKIKLLLANSRPIYYFNFTYSADDLGYLNQNTYHPLGLEIKPAIAVFSQQSLYQIVLFNK